MLPTDTNDQLTTLPSSSIQIETEKERTTFHCAVWCCTVGRTSITDAVSSSVLCNTLGDCEVLWDSLNKKFNSFFFVYTFVFDAFCVKKGFFFFYSMNLVKLGKKDFKAGFEWSVSVLGRLFWD